MNSLPPLQIKSGQGDYSVDFFATPAELVASLLRLERPVIVADRNVVRLYAEVLAPLLQSRPTLLVDATEDTKNPVGVVQAWEFFQKSDATKQTPVIVIGGGIIQDIAQFAAHNYYRGLRWSFVPTTLLAQADSCIGAKCGVNLGAFKNQLGVFHSPAQVLICQRFLETLSDTEIRSGYGEIVKLHLTRSRPELFADLSATIETQGWRNPQLARFIRQSLEVKKGVIEEDEYERGLRRILNYGHTFGHSLEAITHHGIPHGMAIAWGMDLVNFIAWRKSLITEQQFDAVHAFIRRNFSWRLPRLVGAEELIAGTRRDKKIIDGKINLILPSQIGELQIVPCAYDAELTEAVSVYLNLYNVLVGP